MQMCKLANLLTLLSLSLIWPSISSAQELRLQLDWTEYPKQYDVVSRLVEDGLAPIPIVVTDRDVRSSINALVVLHEGVNVLKIGVPQIVERPLYVVTIASDEESVTYNVQYTNASAGSFLTKGDGPVEGIVFDTVIRSKDTIIEPDSEGNLKIRIPAGPYAALIDHALSTGGIGYWDIVPVFYRSGEAIEPPLWDYYRQDIKGLMAALESQSTPAVYMEHVDNRWLLQNANARGILDPEPRERLRLASNPLGALIWIGGNLEGRTTEATISVTRSSWVDIYMTMDGNVTTAGQVECWIDPNLVQKSDYESEEWYYDNCEFVPR